jgi:hypothetical protein
MASQTSAFSDFSQATNFTNASNMGADDASWATATPGPSEGADFTLLDCQGFTLPDNATDLTFALTIKFKTDGVGPIDPAAIVPHLVLGGVDVGDPTGQLGTWGITTSTSDVTQVTGSFIASVTAAQIKQPDFGVYVMMHNYSEEDPVLVSVNYLSLTVDYTVPAGSTGRQSPSLSLGLGL